ncbi:MAG TPA: trimeric intracellular cation channel family protein [Nitrospirota bacterium]|nr:trimeric intracellular cation channel family protein [Nitrospirota bacterium]
MNAFIKTIEILGIIAFALTGIVEARRKGMDIVGVYAVAMVTAFGGGSLRDIILDRHPLFWIEHYEYAVLLLLISIISLTIMKAMLTRKRTVILVLVLDALGLGLFSSSGASIANQLGYAPFVSALLGVITGVFGGVMRDTICKEIPYIFQRRELYATCSFIGAWIYILTVRITSQEIAAVIVCIVVTFSLRMLAIRYKIRLHI